MEGLQIANQGRFGVLVDWLGSTEPGKAEAAATLLREVGRKAVLDLILKARERKWSPAHRLAILDVVQKIGGPFDWTELCLLQSLLGDRNPAVHAKVEEVIMSVSPGGVPRTPEDWVSARAVNPFLKPPPKSRQQPSPGLTILGMMQNCQAVAKRLRKRRAAWQKRDERARRGHP